MAHAQGGGDIGTIISYREPAGCVTSRSGASSALPASNAFAGVRSISQFCRCDMNNYHLFV